MNDSRKYRWITEIINNFTKALSQRPAYLLIFAIWVVFLIFGIGSTIYGIISNKTLSLYLAFLSFVFALIVAIIVIKIVEVNSDTDKDDGKKELHIIKHDIKDALKQIDTLSKSKIEEIIAQYSREKMMDFILECSDNHLNKYETIDDEILKLYRKHGLLELESEPQKSMMQVKYRYEKEIEDDLILVTYFRNYRATNEAKKDSKINKFVNGNGLIGFTSLDFITNLDQNKISEEIIRYINPVLKLTASFELNGLKPGEEFQLFPASIIPENEFDFKILRRDAKSNPTLYGVYNVSKKGKNYKIGLYLYLDVEIPPKQHIDVHIETKQRLPNFYIMSDEFLSWTNGINYELQFSEEFNTDISYSIPGEPPSKATKDELIYKGWIMPHSSISATWKKL
ncbi:MAG: hypothetical protein KAJ19_18740 [Gammaproteobacteria bacterium]|nr:hypothetical protein [Gammaproteobacteria bacterium]